MKKIIIATDAWTPQVNGVVKCIEELKKGLEKKDFKVIIIHPGLFISLPLFFYPEIKVSIFPYRKIKKIIEKEKPDYIHIATEGSIGIVARAICLQKKINFTTSYHTQFSHYVKMRIGFLFSTTYSYLKWFHNVATSTMVCSEGFKKELEGRGFKKIVVWPLGVDAVFFSRNHNLANQKINFVKPIFTYLGRIAKEKNVEEFLKLNLPGTKLVIGDGPLRKKMEKRYKREATFVGYKKGNELVDLLSISDVFVFPSRTDTFGLVIIEALSCGVPIASHDVMSSRDIITNGVDGFLDEDLKIASLKCLKLSAEKCREKALKFSWEKSIDCFIGNLVKV